MHFVKNVMSDEFSTSADYYITVNMSDLHHPFGICVEEKTGKRETADNIYTTALEAMDAARRFADSNILPGNLRDVICDELTARILLKS